MIKVDFQHNTGKYTLIGLTDSIPLKWKGDTIVIDGKKYKTEIVYDLPKHIAVIGSGEFIGKEVVFV